MAWERSNWGSNRTFQMLSMCMSLERFFCLFWDVLPGPEIEPQPRSDFVLRRSGGRTKIPCSSSKSMRIYVHSGSSWRNYCHNALLNRVYLFWPSFQSVMFFRHVANMRQPDICRSLFNVQVSDKSMSNSVSTRAWSSKFEEKIQGNSISISQLYQDGW